MPVSRKRKKKQRTSSGTKLVPVRSRDTMPFPPLGFSAPGRGAEPVRLPEPPGDVQVFRVRLDLDGADPPIWRGLDLRGDINLDRLHHVIQLAMGWQDCHLHRFTLEAAEGTGPSLLTDADVSQGRKGLREADVRLDQTVTANGDRLLYEYDFGDGWTHLLLVEAVRPVAADDRMAVCLQGSGACPPEDVGGVWFYNELAHVLRDGETSPAIDAETLEWLPDDFDPDEFDLAHTDALLARLDSAVNMR